MPTAVVRHDCGGLWKTDTERTQVKLRGAVLEVDQEFFECTQCRQRRVTRKQAATAQEAAAILLRAQEQFLTPDEIRAIRDELGLTQEQLEQALGLGAKTVVRWETGRVIPQRSTDDLLRLIRRDHGALVFLAQQHGAQLPESLDSAIKTAPMNGEIDTEVSAVEGLARLLPRPVFDQAKKTAARQGTDLRTWFLVATTSYLRDTAWGGCIQSAVDEHLEEVAEAFRMTWQIMNVRPQQQREDWLVQHRELQYDAAV